VSLFLCTPGIPAKIRLTGLHGQQGVYSTAQDRGQRGGPTKVAATNPRRAQRVVHRYDYHAAKEMNHSVPEDNQRHDGSTNPKPKALMRHRPEHDSAHNAAGEADDT